MEFAFLVCLILFCNFVLHFQKPSSAKRGDHVNYGWPDMSHYTTYNVSKVGVSALSRIQQRHFDADPRPDIIVNHVHPGWVDTDMSEHLGPLTVEQGQETN